MNKTTLEKRIEERANEHFEKDLKEFISFITHSPIGERIRVKIGNEYIPIANFGQNYGLVNSEGTENKRAELHTNLQEVKNYLLEKYEREETDEILKRLEGINYLFTQQ